MRSNFSYLTLASASPAFDTGRQCSCNRPTRDVVKGASWAVRPTLSSNILSNTRLKTRLSLLVYRQCRLTRKSHLDLCPRHHTYIAYTFYACDHSSSPSASFPPHHADLNTKYKAGGKFRDAEASACTTPKSKVAQFCDQQQSEIDLQQQHHTLD